MTDGSLFNLDAIETTSAPETTDGTGAATPAARDASAPKSLYRKYRPQSFDDDELYGQDHVVNTLRNAIALDRIAHAYLFSGPRGTGKTTTARLLAKAVNCHKEDPNNRPCNQCDACVAINTGATTDVIEIDAASNRGIDDIRDLRERVKYAPNQLSTKFYIIDEAHQITGAAANAFLKTLEEPPNHTKFILATTDPEELLQTIISRCQRFDFRRISLDAMTANLTRVAKAENIVIDDEAKMAIARHATGSMRDALGLLDQVAVYREPVDDENTTVTLDLVRTVLGVSKNERVEEIAAALADKDAGAGLRAVGQAVEDGDDIRHLSRQLLAYLRQLLLARAGGDSELDKKGKSLAKRFDTIDLAELTQKMGDIDFRVKHATISQLPLEIAIVEGALREEKAQTAPATSRPAPPPQQPVSAPASPEREIAPAPRPSWKDKVRSESAPGQPTPQRRPQPSAPPQSQPPTQAQSAPRPAPSSPPPVVSNGGAVNMETIIERWSQIKADVKAVNRRIEALLQQIDPVTINGSKITLVSPYEFHRNRVNADEVRMVIEEVMEHQLGQKVTITCLTRSELENVPPAQIPAPAQPQPAASTPEPPTSTGPGPTSAAPHPEPEPPAPETIDLDRQVDAARNIFDADIEKPES